MIKIKVAIISDIHGNSVALKEVLKDAKKNKVDDYIFLGDLISEFPFVNETLDMVRSVSNKVIRGNKEQYLIEYDKEKYDWKNVQFRNTIFIYNELRKDNLEYIKKLPLKLKLEYDGVKILAVHGSPNSVEESMYIEDIEKFNEYTKNLKEDVLIFGHTHERAWNNYINNKLVINAGCCGVLSYYIGQAEYTIIDIKDGKVDNVTPRLVNYDLEIVKDKIIKCGILDEDRVLINLIYLTINGKKWIKHNFLQEAKTLMLERKHELHNDDAKGIFYKYFKLYDDDIWIGLAEKYEKYFLI